MKNKFLLTATLVAALTLATPLVANAAEAEGGTWKQNATGWWYEYADGNYITNDFCEIDGKTYYFKANGYMATGWQNVTRQNSWGLSYTDWYYFDNSGAMVTGWKQINGKWYYFLEDGCMVQDGITEIDGKDQVFAPSGQWVSGWTWDSYTDPATGLNDYGWFYANADGTPYDYNKEDGELGGWLLSSGTWYYIDDWNGRMYTYDSDSIEYKGSSYRFKHDGAMITGWYQYENNIGSWYYCNADGTVYDGWLAYNGSWYYIRNGEMVTNEWIPSEDPNSDKDYFLGRDGRMVTGWYDCSYKGATETGSAWMYTNADGSRYTGWVASGGKWYYIRSGYMVADEAVKAVRYQDFDDYFDYLIACDVAPYYIFDGTGAMVTGWYQCSGTVGGQKIDTEWYYADADGKGHDGWLLYKGAWYYIDKGLMLTNCYTPDGYWVGADGVWR